MSSMLQQNEPAARSATTHSAEAILAAVVFGAQKFMKESDWTGVLEAWLEQLGAATASDQVRILENDDTAPGELVRASLLAEWRAPGAPGSPIEELQHIPFRGVGCGRW